MIIKINRTIGTKKFVMTYFANYKWCKTSSI